jgi:hypothetical protein
MTFWCSEQTWAGSGDRECLPLLPSSLSAKYGRTGSALDVNQKRPLAKSFRCQYYISSPSSSSSAALAMAAPLLFTSTKWILGARRAQKELPADVFTRRSKTYAAAAANILPTAGSFACMQIVVDSQGGALLLLLLR